MKIIFILLVLIIVVSTEGCATAVGVHEMLPPANYLNQQGTVNVNLDIIRQGEIPSRPVIRIANVAAHGNGYADQTTLENTLIAEARKVNADCLIILSKEVTKDETVGSYSGGLFMSNQIQRPHLYGIACRYSKVRLGVTWNKDGVAIYVSANSSAERAGIKEGQKLLAVNGFPVDVRGYVWDREVGTKNPGDKIVVELLSKDAEKLRKEIILEAAP